jgi:drug/metabolite transporter (DMT)-like permease
LAVIKTTILKGSIKKAFKIFKYLSIVLTLAYWIYMVIENNEFIEKYWETSWLEYLGLSTAYYLIYFLGYSLYYWGISLIFILTYHKIYKPIKESKTTANNT